MATKRTGAPPEPVAPSVRAANGDGAPDRAAVIAAVAAFDGNEITPFDAIFYAVAHIDQKRFLALRMKASVAAGDEIRAMLKTENITSAMLLELGAAAAYEAAGAHGKALEARLEALAICPRYDGFLCALLLSRIAASLLSLDRAEEASPLAERALRFQPLDPPAMVIASWVRTALGDHAGAARLRAWLYDVGTSPAYLPGPPTDADVAAEPYVCDFDALEPLSDAEMAPHTTGARSHFLRDGVRISYPHQGATTLLAREDDWFPLVEIAATGRSKCKVCKAAIAAGEARLVVRSKTFPVESAYAHAKCAPTHKKLGLEWKRAAPRSRLVLAGRV